MSARATILAISAGGAILAMLADRAPAQTAPPAAGKPAAIVNGETISLAEVESVMAALRGGGPEPAQVPEAKRREMRHLALGFLIDEVLFQQALRGGPPVNSQEVDQRIVELIKALGRENKKLEDFCRESGQTVAQLQARIVPPGEVVVIAGVMKHAAVHHNRFPVRIALLENALDRLVREVRLVVANAKTGDEHSALLARIHSAAKPAGESGGRRGCRPTTSVVGGECTSGSAAPSSCVRCSTP